MSMLVFPLGLEAKTRGFPWATVTVFIGAMAYSMINFDALHAYQIAKFNAPEMNAMAKAQAAFAAAACRQSLAQAPNHADRSGALKKEDCDALARSAAAPLGANVLDSLQPIARRPAAMAFYQDVERWRRPSASLRRLPEAAAFAFAAAEADRALAKIAKAERVFIGLNRSPKAIIRSEFLHAGWMHLLGNMAFFLVFAIPLEARLGPALFLAIYFVGGTIGDLAQVSAFGDPTMPLVGASACIMAVAGAFMAAFWNASMRVWASLFFLFSQTVLMPTWIFFLGYVLAEQAAGALAAQGAVAYLAHLGAFAPGFAMGWIALRARPVAPGCAFPFEQGIVERARAAADVSIKLNLFNEALAYNAKNFVVVDEGWQALRACAEAAPWAEAPGAARAFARAQGGRLLEAKEGAALAEAIDVLRIANWPGAEFLRVADLVEFERRAAGLGFEGSHPAQALALAGWIRAAYAARKPTHATLKRMRAIATLERELSGRADRPGSAA